MIERNNYNRNPRQRKPGIWHVILSALLVTAVVFLTSKPSNGEKQAETATDSQQNLPVSEAEKSEDSESEAEKPEDREEENAESAPVSSCTKPEDVLLSGMTLHEKICQLFIVYPEAITGVSPALTAGEETSDGLESWPVGGFLYDAKNMRSKDQVKLMLDNVQSYAKIPLILTCDEEGGRVNRLMSSVGTTYIGPMLSFKDQGIDTARTNAQIISTDMASLGFNLDLAPVADVWSNSDNTVIADRAYSDDFQQAAQLVSAAVQGFHDGGIACTLKHFPGHGDTSTDSHNSSAYVSKSLTELRGSELIPFQAGIDAGADAVLVGHLIVTEVSGEPAPFSYQILTQLLRQEMDFQGVIMTDGLQMRAISDYFTSEQVAVKAVSAGIDLLLCPEDLASAVSALKQAVESGEITESRIDESVLRIMSMKLEYGIIKTEAQ